MFCAGIPIALGNAQALMRSLHVAAGVDTGTTGSGTKLVEDVLANPLFRILAMSGEEFRKSVI